MLGQANSVLWNLLHNTHDELHLQPRGGKGTIAGSAYTSETTGLAARLCIALVLVLVFGLYLMRRRLFRRPANNYDAGPEAQECCEPNHDRLTMSELRSLDITNKPFGAWRHNSVCSQDEEDPHGLHNSRECSICVEPYPEENTTLRQLLCGHEFHRRCVDAWLLNRSGTCPLCRVRVMKFQNTALSLPVSPSPIFSALGRWSSLRRESTIVTFTYPCPCNAQPNEMMQTTPDGMALRSVPSIQSQGPGSMWIARTTFLPSNQPRLAVVSEVNTDVEAARSER